MENPDFLKDKHDGYRVSITTGAREYFDGADWLAYDDSHPQMLVLQKLDGVKATEEFADTARSSFLGNISGGKLRSYQLNIDILNLLDSGVVFDALDPVLRQKVEIEVATDNRYTTIEELLTVWRSKRGTLAVVSAWADAFENNTIADVNAAATKAEIDTILATAKVAAEAKAAELTNTLEV